MPSSGPGQTARLCDTLQPPPGHSHYLTPTLSSALLCSFKSFAFEHIIQFYRVLKDTKLTESV